MATSVSKEKLPSLAIVGCGVSGLTSLKHGVECKQFAVSCFEKESSIGGIWKPDTGFVWDNLVTNLSKYSCMFSDFMIESENIFPTQYEMNSYLKDYCKHFNLSKFIKFNCNVIKISRIANHNNGLSKYVISWKERQDCGNNTNNFVINSEIFDFVIIASGIFSKAIKPSYLFNNSVRSRFEGNIIHSSEYKSLSKLKSKSNNIVIIGNSFSAYEIAYDIMSNSNCKNNQENNKNGKNEKNDKNNELTITHIISRAHWILPRFITKNNLPLDWVFYTHPKDNQDSNNENDNNDINEMKERNDFDIRWTDSETNFKKNKFLQSVSQTMDEEFYDSIDFGCPSRVAICNNYSKYLNNRNNNSNDTLNLMQANIVKIEKNGIWVQSIHDEKKENKDNNNNNNNNNKNKDATFVKCDTIVACTGYELDLTYFDKSIQNILNYNEKDQLQPILLYKCTFHPNLDYNIGFVGIYRGPYFAVMEMQAKWCINIFSKKYKLPSKSTMNQYIEIEKSICKNNINDKNRPQFSHGDYPGLLNGIANEINISPIKNMILLKKAIEKNQLSSLSLDRHVMIKIVDFFINGGPILSVQYGDLEHENNANICMSVLVDVYNYFFASN